MQKITQVNYSGGRIAKPPVHTMVVLVTSVVGVKNHTYRPTTFTNSKLMSAVRAPLTIMTGATHPAASVPCIVPLNRGLNLHNPGSGS